MNTEQWNKCFVWMMAAFPSWQPDAAVSMVWYDEIGKNCEPEVFKNIVRLLNEKKPLPFPCGLFEVKAELKCIKQGCDDQTFARKMFRATVENYNRQLFDSIDPRAKIIMSKLGGYSAFRNMQERDMPKLEESFIREWIRTDHDSKRQLVAATPAFQKMNELASGVVKRLEAKDGTGTK
jgi:hypothetical protein